MRPKIKARLHRLPVDTAVATDHGTSDLRNAIGLYQLWLISDYESSRNDHVESTDLCILGLAGDYHASSVSKKLSVVLDDLLVINES